MEWYYKLMMENMNQSSTNNPKILRFYDGVIVDVPFWSDETVKEWVKNGGKNCVFDGSAVKEVSLHGKYFVKDVESGEYVTVKANGYSAEPYDPLEDITEKIDVSKESIKNITLTPDKQIIVDCGDFTIVKDFDSDEVEVHRGEVVYIYREKTEIFRIETILSILSHFGKRIIVEKRRIIVSHGIYFTVYTNYGPGYYEFHIYGRKIEVFLLPEREWSVELLENLFKVARLGASVKARTKKVIIEYKGYKITINNWNFFLPIREIRTLLLFIDAEKPKKKKIDRWDFMKRMRKKYGDWVDMVRYASDLSFEELVEEHPIPIGEICIPTDGPLLPGMSKTVDPHNKTITVFGRKVEGRKIGVKMTRDKEIIEIFETPLGHVELGNKGFIELVNRRISVSGYNIPDPYKKIEELEKKGLVVLKYSHYKTTKEYKQVRFINGSAEVLIIMDDSALASITIGNIRIFGEVELDKVDALFDEEITPELVARLFDEWGVEPVT